MKNNLKDYYYILEVDNNASEEEIYESYKNKISKFNNLPFHTPKMISEIKLLKEALYVLGDNERRAKYNKKCIKMQRYSEEGRQIDNTQVHERLFSINFNNL